MQLKCIAIKEHLCLVTSERMDTLLGNLALTSANPADA